MQGIPQETATAILSSLEAIFTSPDATKAARKYVAKATQDKTPIENLSVTVRGVVTNEQLHALVRLSASTGVSVSSIRSGVGQTFTYAMPTPAQLPSPER
ncbi:MAG TPA: hypothetical protein VF629_02980 [Hymenobacter sp.]|jgi:cysteine sulfinate desulfinase/cysteine desulfurase-like protein|uniref:hypothetical protein n=1 Tax=Hymenobacter sp. TaxID=1898978 RepID=UPI002ED9E359